MQQFNRRRIQNRSIQGKSGENHPSIKQPKHPQKIHPPLLFEDLGIVTDLNKGRGKFQMGRMYLSKYIIHTCPMLPVKK